MQDLNELLFFAEVVDHGGFAAAGRALNLPKSRLSRRVAELEARLGVRLLHRTTRKLSLTEAGELCYRHCAAMREQASRGTADAVAVVQNEPRGTLRGLPGHAGADHAGPILPVFLARYPQVRIDMRVSNRVVDLVEEGVDVALRVRASAGRQRQPGGQEPGRHRMPCWLPARRSWRARGSQRSVGGSGTPGHRRDVGGG
jgi:DNA-binding transcriptional LysR family regulator